jgi:hypothetical protein
VIVVEPLGDRKDVYMETARGDKFIANINPHIDIRVDQAVTMYMDAEKINIFEPGNTGKNVSLQG